MPQLLGAKLKYLRNHHGLTQSQVAQLLSFTSYTYIQMIEKGQRVPTIQWVIRMAMVFDQTTDYFLRDSVPIDTTVKAHIKSIEAINTSASLFGSKVLELRKRAGWSQAGLAQKLGLASQGSVSKLESGRKMPSLDLAVEIADLFQVSTDYLLRETIVASSQSAPET